MFVPSFSVQRHMAAEFAVSRCVFITEAGLEELKWWSRERCVNSDAGLCLSHTGSVCLCTGQAVLPVCSRRECSLSNTHGFRQTAITST